MAQHITLTKPTSRNESKQRYWTMARKRSVMAWLFMVPALLVLSVFTFYPLLYGIVLAFFHYNMMGGSARFVGFDNFTKAFHDKDFGISLLHSAEYLLIVPLIQIFSIALAVLINVKLRGVVFFRATFYIPVITSYVVASIVWGYIYQADYGLLNSIDRWVQETYKGSPIHRFKGPDWLGDPRYALASIAFVTLWKGLGYYMVIYLAGLQSIPKDLEEAARIDGAGVWGTFRYVTLPLLTPAIALCTILSTIAALRVFDEVFVMSGGEKGAPAKSTLVANVYIYANAFGKDSNFDFGYAAALSLCLAAVIWVFTVMNLKVLNRGGVDY